MAVSLLTDEPILLTNMPRLRDTRFMGQLLAHMGVEVEEGPGAKMRLHAKELTNLTAPYDLVRKMRATFNVLGPTLARARKAKVSLPGGCAIGARPVDLHLKALEALGATIELSEGYVEAEAKDGLVGADITFPFISVGATEHAMLAAVLPTRLCLTVLKQGLMHSLLQPQAGGCGLSIFALIILARFGR